MKLMTAKEATQARFKERSTRSYKSEKIEWRLIVKKVKKAVHCGAPSVWWGFGMYWQNIEHLKELGYRWLEGFIIWRTL